MKIDIITLFPKMIEDAVQYGVLGAGIKNGLIQVQVLNPREFTHDNHKTVDDRPFGGGDGMVMLADPLAKSIEKLKSQKSRIVYLSPQGKLLNNEKVLQLSKEEHLVLLSGRYGGIDERILCKYAIEEISIGDYVLSGGEFAALVLIDSIARQIPGFLGHLESAANDSFNDGLLEAPQFTRPREWDKMEVPQILLDGNHAKISEWKKNISLLVTLAKRPEVFSNYLMQNKQNKVQLIRGMIDYLEGLSDSQMILFKLNRQELKSQLTQLVD